MYYRDDWGDDDVSTVGPGKNPYTPLQDYFAFTKRRSCTSMSVSRSEPFR